MLGEAGVEQLLKTTIEGAVSMGTVKKTEFERVIVDPTVQRKAIAPPTHSRLLEVAHVEIARLAKRCGIQLKPTREREGRTLRRMAGGYVTRNLGDCLRSWGRLGAAIRSVRDANKVGHDLEYERKNINVHPCSIRRAASQGAGAPHLRRR